MRKIRLANSNKSLVRIRLEEGKTVPAALLENWDAKDPRILRIEPNYQVYALELPDDPYLGYLWGFYNYGQTQGTSHCDINMPQAWEITTGSSDVVVAVIDSGVDYTHPDLANQIWMNTDEIPDNGLDDDQNGYIDDCFGYDFAENDSDPFDENGHGTHCAGTIAAEGNNHVGVAGISWRSKIMPCRFLNADGSGTVTDAIEAINYAVANGAHILSNSWGGSGFSTALRTAIENAENQGVLFVAAAGNSGTDNDVAPQYPSSYPCSNIIAVAATDHHDHLAAFSCYGRKSVDISAPGVNILSTVPGGYTWYSGTSMATPHVSGAAALLLSFDPEMTLGELKSRLLWSGDPVAELQAVTLTGRRLNTYQALTAENGFLFLSPTENTVWVAGFRYDINWSTIGANSTVSLSLLKSGQVIDSIGQQIANTGSYSWTIPAATPYGTDYSVLIEDGTLSEVSENFTITDEHPDFYTESFTTLDRPFDLSNQSVLFVPDGAGSYQAIAHAIGSLPVSPDGGKRLRLGDDDSVAIELGERTVELFGIVYDHLYVGSNGYLTFDEPDQEYRVQLSNHFQQSRISVFYSDLNPAAGGRVSWKEIRDRIVISWEAVPEFNRAAFHTFQAELFFDGKIRLSWLGNAQKSCIVGISGGTGLAEDYLDSDVSAYCSYRPDLQFIKINGPEKIVENNLLQLQCTGYFEDDVTFDVTEHDVQWNIDSDAGAIDATGFWDVGQVDIFRHINITAQTENKTDRFGIFVKGETVHDLQVTKCLLKAGSNINTDSLDLAGLIPITEGAIYTADSIDVKIWSSRNECVLEAIFENPSASMRRQVFAAKQSIATSTGSSTQMLRLDSKRNLLRLSIRNADLTGISCPFYVTVHCGNRTYAGQLREPVVNNSRHAPVELMNGVENLLLIDRLKLTSMANILNSGKLSLNGQFSLGAEVLPADAVTFRLNSISCSGLLTKSSRRYDVFESEDGSFSAQIDFTRGKFFIRADNFDIDPDMDMACISLAFDAFDETQKIDL